MNREPDIEKQLQELEDRYRAGTITKSERDERMASIARNHEEWLRKNE